MKPLGDGFIKLIKMIITPIIFCTVVLGIVGRGGFEEGGPDRRARARLLRNCQHTRAGRGSCHRKRGSARRRSLM